MSVSQWAWIPILKHVCLMMFCKLQKMVDPYDGATTPCKKKEKRKKKLLPQSTLPQITAFYELQNPLQNIVLLQISNVYKKSKLNFLKWIETHAYLFLKH